MEDYTVTRRSVNKAGAWAMPVVLAAIAAPAAQGSQTPPEPTPVCIAGVTFTGLDSWQKNGNGPLWQGVQFYNSTSKDITLKGTVDNASSHLYGVDGADTFTLSGPGNDANFTATIPAGGSVILRVEVETESDNDSCFLTVDVCAVRFHMKTVGKNDRLGQ